MAQYFQISFDQLKQLFPDLSGTVGEENVQYTVVNHGQEVALNNIQQVGNIQPQEDARQGSISNSFISAVKAEQLNGQYSIALKSDTPDPNNIYVLESVSSSNPGTVHMQNSVPTQADHHQTISADSNHLQTIYITTSPQQVAPAVAYISVPHTVVNEVSATPQSKVGTSTKNSCQAFSTEEEVQVPTANNSLSKNKENLISSEEKEAEESEGIIHGSVLAGAQVRNIQQNCTVNRPNSQTETKRPSLQLIALSSSPTAASQTRQTNSSCQLSTTQVSLPNGQQISLQDYRRMNPQINSVQPSKGLARGHSGVRQFSRVRRAARRGASIHSPVRQSSAANSLTPGRMILVDQSGEGEPMQFVVRNDSSQDGRDQEQQQVGTHQDSNTAFQFGQSEERQQVVMLVPSGSGEHQMVTLTMPANEANSNMSSVTTPENSPRAIGRITPSSKFASPTGTVLMNTGQRRSIGPEGVIEQSSSSGFLGSPSLSKQNEERKLVPGKVAHCQYCGYHSEDFNRCERCRRKVPVNCKEMPITHSKVSKDGFSFQKFYRGIREGTMADNIQKSDRTPRKKLRKPFEEPVILTISSDEDEDAERKADAKSKEENVVDTDGGLISMNSVVEPVLLPMTSISALEPVIKDNEEGPVSEDEADVAEEIAVEVQEGQNGIATESAESRPVYLTCRTVRIGSYKAVPKERVVICKQGVRISVPDIEDGSKIVTIIFRLKDIVRALIHFGRAMPVIFLYTTHPCAVKIRSVLNMSTKKGPYYDPTCNEETQKRITLLPERMTEDTKARLKMLFGFKDLLIELDNKDANDILVRASPKEVQDTIKKTVTAASPTMSTARPSKDYFQKILIYPPPPAKGGITINPEDYCCLGEEQFLNDVIIDFYLKYLTQSCLSEEDQQRTHVFSSFFYKRLTTRPVRSARRHHPMELDSTTTAAEKRHARVKSWTKSVDIFEKDFIVIPINESAHWFLAIICFPGLEGCVRMSDGVPVKLPPPQPKASRKPKPETKKNEMESKELPPQACIMKSIQIGSTTITPITPPGASTSNLMIRGEKEQVSIDERDGGTIVDDVSDRDEAEGEEEEDIQMPSESEDEAQQEGKEEKEEAGQEDEKPAEGTTEENAQSADDKAPDKEATTVEKEDTKESPEREEEKPKDSEIEYCSPKVPIKQPCILIFDSLAGSSRSRVVATLRDYLRIEYKVKKGKEREFSKDTIRGACPRVPQQTNFVDCGVYVLQYVESFFQNPIKDYRIPIRSLTQWFPEEVAHTKREAIHELILKLMKEQNITCKLPKITLPSAASRANQPNPQDEESMKKLEMCSKLVEPGQLIIKSKEGGHRVVTGGLRVISFSKNSLNLVLETQCEDVRMPMVSEMQMSEEERMQGASTSRDVEMSMEVEDGEAIDDEEMEEGEVVEPPEGEEEQMEDEEDEEIQLKQKEEIDKLYAPYMAPLATKRKPIKQDVLESEKKESHDNDNPNKKSKC